MRFIFLIVLLAGLALGIFYPWATANFSGSELERRTIYTRSGGFIPTTVGMSAEDAPVRVMVDMTSIGAMTLSGEQTVLTLTATVKNHTVLASTLTFAHHEPRPDNPQAGGMIYRDEAGIQRLFPSTLPDVKTYTDATGVNLFAEAVKPL